MLAQAQGLRAPVPQELCPCQIKKYEKLDSEEERTARSRHIFDHYIMKELLACSHVSAVLCRPCPCAPVPSAQGDTVPSCLTALLQECHGACPESSEQEAGAPRPLPGGHHPGQRGGPCHLWYSEG